MPEIANNSKSFYLKFLHIFVTSITLIFIAALGLHWAMLCHYLEPHINKYIKIPNIIIINGLMFLQITFLCRLLGHDFYLTSYLVGTYLLISLFLGLIFSDHNYLDSQSHWKNGLKFEFLLIPWIATIIVFMCIPILQNKGKPTFIKASNAIEAFGKFTTLHGYTISESSLKNYDTTIVNRQLKNSFRLIIIKPLTKEAKTILLEYKEFIKNEFKKNGIAVKEKSPLDSSIAFEYSYYRLGIHGVFKATFIEDINGYINAEVFYDETIPK